MVKRSEDPAIDHEHTPQKPSVFMGVLIDDLAAKIQAGESIDIDSYVDKLPEQEMEIRRLAKSLEALADFNSCSQNPDSQPHPNNHIDFPPTLDSAPKKRTVANENLIGSHIGPYTIREKLGEGGFGMVYVAEQSRPIKRKVALKVIKPGMDSKEVIARFDAERQALAMMDHPNVARVIDGGRTEDGRPYFVMELVYGTRITDFCDGQKLDLGERLQLFREVCHGIQHAHHKGIIHRDIKPSNVLVTMRDDTPVAKVIDFGVAKALHQRLTEQSVYTAFGQIVGTPLYMSPEQIQLNELDVDTRSDVYSLGSLLYEMLSGTTPFTREQLDQKGILEFRKLVNDSEPPNPSHRLSTARKSNDVTAVDKRQFALLQDQKKIQGELDWIVMKALEKDRKRRYQSASEFADDIDRFLNGEAVAACPPSVSYRLAKHIRRHVTAFLAAAIVLLSLLGGLLTTSLQAHRARKAEAAAIQQGDRANEARNLAQNRLKAEKNARTAEAASKQLAERRAEEAEAAKLDAMAAKREALQNLYVSDMRLGTADIKSGNSARLSRNLYRHDPTEQQSDLRGWEWYYLLSHVHQEEQTFYDVGGPIFGVEFSPNGRYLAAISRESNHLCIWDLRARHQPVKVITLRDVPSACHWQRDSNSLAVASANPPSELWIIDVQTGTGQTISDASSGGELNWGLRSLAWSPDGTSLTTQTHHRVTKRWDLVTDTIEQIELPPGRMVVPIGTLVGTTGNPGGVVLRDPESGQVLEENQDVKASAAAQWDVHGARLALSDQGVVSILRTEDLTVVSTIQVPGVTRVRFDPSGQKIAAVSQDGFARIYAVAGGELLREFAAHKGPSTHIDWSPDGKSIATGGNDHIVRLWNLDKQPSNTVETLSISSPRRIRRGQEPGTLAITNAIDSRERMEGKEAPIALIDISGRQLNEESLPKTLAGESSNVLLCTAVSPDHSLIAIAEAMPDDYVSIRVVDANSGETISRPNLLRPVWQRVDGMSISPDGSKLVAWARYGFFCIWESWTGKPVWDSHKHDSPSSNMAQTRAVDWAADGDRLAVAAERGARSSMLVFDLETLEYLWRQSTNTEAHQVVRWSRDNTRIAFGSADGELTICNAADGNVLINLHSHSSAITAIDWGAHDDRLLVLDDLGAVKILDPLDGTEVMEVTSTQSSATAAAWSESGEQLVIAFEGGKIQMLDASRGYQFADSEAYPQARAAHFLAKSRAEDSYDEKADCFINALDSGITTAANFGSAVHTLYASNQFARAIELAQRAIAEQKDTENTWYYMARSYQALNEPQKAIESYGALIERYSAYWTAPKRYQAAWIRRAELRLQQGDNAGAKRDIEKYMQMTKAHLPQHIWSQLRLKHVLSATEMALTLQDSDLQSKLMTFSDSHHLLNDIVAAVAIAHVEPAVQELALERIVSAVRRDPESHFKYATLGEMLCSAGQPNLALFAMNKSIQVRGEESPWHWLWLAKIYGQLGDPFNAVKYLALCRESEGEDFGSNFLKLLQEAERKFGRPEEPSPAEFHTPLFEQALAAFEANDWTTFAKLVIDSQVQLKVWLWPNLAGYLLAEDEQNWNKISTFLSAEPASTHGEMATAFLKGVLASPNLETLNTHGDQLLAFARKQRAEYPTHQYWTRLNLLAACAITNSTDELEQVWNELIQEPIRHQIGIFFHISTYYHRMCDDSLLKRCLRHMREIAQDHPDAQFVDRHLGGIFFRCGHYAEARRAFEKSISVRGKGEAWEWVYLAMVHHHLGNRDQALEYLQDARQSMPRINGFPHQAGIYILIDEAERLIQPDRRQ